jgi:phage tail-like protein
VTKDELRSYRFATEAQWQSCLFAQADRASLRSGQGVRPLAPYARSGTLYETRGARAPVVTRFGEVLWFDGNGALQRFAPGDDSPVENPPPFSVPSGVRVVATSNALWVNGNPSGSLRCYEEDSLSRLLSVEIPDGPVVDITSDGRDSVFMLHKGEAGWQSVRVDRGGHCLDSVRFEGVSHVRAFVYLRQAERFVLLAGKGPGSDRQQKLRLYWFSREGGQPQFSRGVASARPCFRGDVLGTDGRERVFLAGSDGDEFGGHAYVLVFDGDGNELGDVPLDPLDAPATGVTASRERLLVTSGRGLVAFDLAPVVPEGAGQVRCLVVTPMLHSPDREDGRRWLRVEATGQFPEGSTLEVSYAATADAAVRDRLNALLASSALPASQRIAELLEEPGLWRGRTEFRGKRDAGTQGRTFSAKLFDVREPYLWVSVALSAAAGAALPMLSELSVLYPGRTLMENLPAIYQAEEERPDSFLRALVGVLETTTQDLDRRIGSLGSRVHPATASEPWLDFIARWLGVPWDDALSPAQKQALLKSAPELAKTRGTRAGLEALLQALMPGTPRRFRVTDATADHGFAIVGDAGCAGSRLPALLGGRTRWSAELGSRSVLGYLRLPCPGQLDDGAWQLAGKVSVEVAATAAERQAWQAWLPALIAEMVPLTARVQLRWVSGHALRSDRLDASLTLESAPEPHLGTDAITGLARLPERKTRLSASGPNISMRLR